MLEKRIIQLGKFVPASKGLLKLLNHDLVAEKCKVINFDSCVIGRAFGVNLNVSGVFFYVYHHSTYRKINTSSYFVRRFTRFVPFAILCPFILVRKLIFQ